MRTVRGASFVAVGALIAATLVTLGTRPAAAATLPLGFATGPIVSGLSQPTSLTPLPDGRVLVTQKTGELRIITPATSTVTGSLLTLAVCTQSERGALGAAVDPSATASGGSIYVYYTVNGPAGCKNRVQRFAWAGNSIVAGPLLLDNVPSVAGNHNGGDLHFGRDGFLYVSVGDSGCSPRNGGSARGATRPRRTSAS